MIFLSTLTEDGDEDDEQDSDESKTSVEEDSHRRPTAKRSSSKPLKSHRQNARQQIQQSAKQRMV